MLSLEVAGCPRGFFGFDLNPQGFGRWPFHRETGLGHTLQLGLCFQTAQAVQAWAGVCACAGLGRCMCVGACV